MPYAPDQQAAHAAVTKAIREGRLVRPTACAVCNVASRWLVMHHHSYAPEHHLDVVALCRRCHQHVHLGAIPEPLTGELRTGDRVKRCAPKGPRPDIREANARRREVRAARAAAFAAFCASERVRAHFVTFGFLCEEGLALLGPSPALVSMVRSGRRWTHVPDAPGGAR